MVRTRARGVGPPRPGRAHQPVPDHGGDLPRAARRGRRSPALPHTCRPSPRSIRRRSPIVAGLPGPLSVSPATTIRTLVERVLPLLDRDDDPVVTTILGGMRLSRYLPTRNVRAGGTRLDIAAGRGTRTAHLRCRAAHRGARADSGAPWSAVRQVLGPDGRGDRPGRPLSAMHERFTVDGTSDHPCASAWLLADAGPTGTPVDCLVRTSGGGAYPPTADSGSRVRRPAGRQLL